MVQSLGGNNSLFSNVLCIQILIQFSKTHSEGWRLHTNRVLNLIPIMADRVMNTYLVVSKFNLSSGFADRVINA